jgi:hypothetical protein
VDKTRNMYKESGKYIQNFVGKPEAKKNARPWHILEATLKVILKTRVPWRIHEHVKLHLP